MEQIQKIDIRPTEAAIIATIAFMIVGEKTWQGKSKIDLLEDSLKKTQYEQYKYYNHKTKDVLRFMRGSYANWKERVFRNKGKFPEIAEIQRRCEYVSKHSVKYFTKLKDAISRFLLREDCVCVEPMSYLVTIVSLVAMGNNYCSMSIDVLNKQIICANSKEDRKVFEAYSNSINTIRDEQFKRNCCKMYALVNYPDGLDVNADEGIVGAMDELSEELWNFYVDNFLTKEEKENGMA